MSDIFISYSSSDREMAQKFANALEAFGWSVWWDREIPLGKTFDQVIEEELNAARCVLVLWSKESVLSRWVKTEASAAADRERLVPVLIDKVAIPLEFRRIQTAMLLAWGGDTANREFQRLLQAVREMVGQAARGRPLAPEKTTGKISSWWQTSPRLLGAIGGALMIILAVIFAKNIFRTGQEPARQDSKEPASGSIPASPTAAGNPVPSSLPLAGSRKPAGAKGAFSIKIGDKIDDGIPAPGAGSIETPYGHDVYVFTAAPAQRVYFRMLRHSQGWPLFRGA
jgi:hypothetical protein